MFCEIYTQAFNFFSTVINGIVLYSEFLSINLIYCDLAEFTY